LMLEPRLPVGLLGDLKRLGRVGQKLIAPLVLLRLADVVVLTDGGYRFALEAFKHDGGLGLRVPLAPLHG
ncbi:MAG: hypothetical protein ACREIH_05940, partial [Nitrospiraceae bacterium]